MSHLEIVRIASRNRLYRFAASGEAIGCGRTIGVFTSKALMSDKQDDRLHRLRNDFITLTEAASIAHVHMMRGRLDTTIPDAQLNALANTLTRLITLYSMSDDWTSVRSLTAEDMRGGLIAGGGKVIKFQDGRPAIFGLVITRTSLKAALEAL